ncbi:MAG: hypothetical protein ACYC61_14985 [Isosphaeraceae bacterium]
MNETDRVFDGPVARRTSVGLSAVLALSTIITVGYWAARAIGKADNEAMESPLMLSVARQLVTGPGELYGPFGRTNPLVLIHAPLYYRAAAALAWPMMRMGLDPVDAARVSGRILSFAGLLASAIAAGRLARLGGLPRRAGWWAAGLVASAPVLAGIPYAVRPDMLGVACQTWAVALAAESLVGARSARSRGWRMVVASVLFGLAVCVKQHLVAAWTVTGVWSAVEWLRGRSRLDHLAFLILPGVVASGLIYAVEWQVTGGRIWEAAVVAASNVSRVHPGSWDSVLVVALGILNRSAGLVAVLAAGPAMIAAARGGAFRTILAAAGTLAIGLLLVALVRQAQAEPGTPQSARAGALTMVCIGVCAVVAMSVTLGSRNNSSPGADVGVPLWAFVVAELAVVILLSKQSSGAWINYGIPATVFAAALAARGLSRLPGPAASGRTVVPVGLAALAILVSGLTGLAEDRRHDRGERGFVNDINSHVKRDRSSYYFTTRPGRNRLNGRLELVHDDWLYPVFERIGLAEPRSDWLRKALGSQGPVRAVVATSPEERLEGTSLNLRRLGYRKDIAIGPFYVWIR